MALDVEHDPGFVAALMRSVGEGVYATDEQGRLTYMNRMAERLLGWDERELLGRNVHEAIHFQNAAGEPLPQERCRLLSVIASGEAVADEDVFTRRDGAVFPVAYSSAPIRDGEAIKGAVVAFRDRTAELTHQNERQRLQDEHAAVARALQAGLLPAVLPTHEYLELAASFRPASDDVVGGDFYDAYEIPGGFALVIGDVCGKGAEAAAVTGLARWVLRGATQSGADAVAALNILNRALLGHASDRYLTAALIFVRETGDGLECQSVTAGHPAPLLRRSDGTVTELYDPGTLLGIYPDLRLAPVRCTLHEGDAVVLYTDGLLEARRSVAQPQDPPVEALGSCVRASAAQIVTHLEQATGVLAAPVLRDDVAMLVLRAGGARGQRRSTPSAPVHDEVRKRQVGLNEAEFRWRNERVEAGHPLADEEVAFLCECGHRSCHELVQVRRSTYEQVRSHPLHFLLVPGHEITETETVIARQGGHVVVRKDPEVADIAQDSDPRST